MIYKDKYISLLESFKKRKGMYITPEVLDSAANFLSGFICSLLSQNPGLHYPNDLIIEIGSERGWKKSASGPKYLIQQSDLTEDKKINELVDIYIESIKRMST